MRVTSSMYYENIYGNNNSKLSKELFDVNKQIASGLKIQYAKDDVRVFTETMRLDNEVTVLGQIKQSTESGYKVSNQSDTTLNEFDDRLNRMKTLLIQSSSAANSSTSMDAIAKELRGIEKNLISLANTSINGQYLFSGSAIDVKPISDDGTYNGNNVAMNAFLGSDNKQQYNLTGAELFLGEELTVNREITTNVVNKNLLADYPELQDSEEDQEPVLTTSSTIRQLMGDTDEIIDPVTDKHFFYVRGTSSDGTAFKTKFAMNDAESVQDLLNNIGDAYGNTANLKLVNVSMNDSGQIVVEDKQKGSSKLDFHMVGAVDYSAGTGGAADVNDIDLLNSGETNFKEIANPTTPPANNLFVKEFIKSGFSAATGAAQNIEGILYDRTQFTQSGSKLSSNVSQIVKEDNSFASDKTKLHEVFSGISYNTDGSYNSGLDSKTLQIEGTQVDGVTPYTASINLSDTVSQFTINGNTYDFYNVDGSQVEAENITYRQMMDVVNMAITGEVPAADTALAVHAAAKESTTIGETFLSYDGKLEFGQNNTTSTKATLSIYDASSEIFPTGVGTAVGSTATFNTNNALTITDPKTDFFKTINEMITAVEEYKEYPDASSGNARSVGIQNGIAMIDDLLDHVSRSHSVVGANSNTLSRTLERTEILEISTMSLRSATVDTDIAEASLKLSQLSLNYQAMLSTVGKVSQLSLVNYL